MEIPNKRLADHCSFNGASYPDENHFEHGTGPPRFGDGFEPSEILTGKQVENDHHSAGCYG